MSVARRLRRGECRPAALPIPAWLRAPARSFITYVHPRRYFRPSATARTSDRRSCARGSAFVMFEVDRSAARIILRKVAYHGLRGSEQADTRHRPPGSHRLRNQTRNRPRRKNSALLPINVSARAPAESGRTVILDVANYRFTWWNMSYDRHDVQCGSLVTLSA